MSAIIDVRGKGLMIAAELDSADLAKLTVAEMLKRHILINCTSETVLRFLPPYILERAHVDTAIAALDEIFTEHAAQPAQQPQRRPQEARHVASRATIESRQLHVPVQKDPDILAAAARSPARTCAPSPISPAPKSAPFSSSATTSSAIRANIAMRSTPSRWC